jgi:hypothetical protein
MSNLFPNLFYSASLAFYQSSQKTETLAHETKVSLALSNGWKEAGDEPEMCVDLPAVTDH